MYGVYKNDTRAYVFVASATPVDLRRAKKGNDSVIVPLKVVQFSPALWIELYKCCWTAKGLETQFPMELNE